MTSPPPHPFSVQAAYTRGRLARIDLELLARLGPGGRLRASMRERGDSGVAAGGFTYGEMRLKALLRMLELLELSPDERFADMGSGVGRVGLLVHTLTGARVRGIEAIGSFVATSRAVASRMGLRDCHFEQGDLRTADWAWPDVVYSATTAFDDALMQCVQERALDMRPGTRLVTVTQPPVGEAWTLEAMEVLDFSWGPGTLFIHRRA